MILIYNKFSKEVTRSLKAILALVIVGSHLHYATNLFLFLLINKIGTTAVALFFFISGYGLTVSYINKGEIYLKGFWHKRIWLVFKPMLFATILYLLLDFCDKGCIKENILTNLFFHGQTPLPNSWFIFSIIIFYISFYISFSYFHNNNISLIVLYVLLSIFIFITIYLHYDRCWWVTTYAFLSGAIYADKRRILFLFFRKKVVLFGCCILIVGIMISKVEILLLFPYILIPIMIIILLCYMKIPTHNEILNSLGIISYEIYLMHGIFISLLRGMKIQIHSDILYATLVYLGSIISAYIFHYILNIKIVNMNLKKSDKC